MTQAHDSLVEEAFSIQAAAFEDPRFNATFTSEAEWIFSGFPLHDQDLALDVAAGTGHAARTLAPSVRTVIALDATAAMLAQGRAAVAKAGLRNVIFMQGDATALPFLDHSFNVVVCRFAMHHFLDARGALAQMVRCMRVGGRLLVADLLSHDDPQVAQTQNELERLRDPSHTRMLTQSEVAETLASLGVASIAIANHEQVRPLRNWLRQSQTDEIAARKITDVLNAELAGGAATGFSPTLLDGELHFTHRFAALSGIRYS